MRLASITSREENDQLVNQIRSSGKINVHTFESSTQHKFVSSNLFVIDFFRNRCWRWFLASRHQSGRSSTFLLDELRYPNELHRLATKRTECISFKWELHRNAEGFWISMEWQLVWLSKLLCMWGSEIDRYANELVHIQNLHSRIKNLFDQFSIVYISWTTRAAVLAWLHQLTFCLEDSTRTVVLLEWILHQRYQKVSEYLAAMTIVISL